jgi:hypothetical protein
MKPNPGGQRKTHRVVCKRCSIAFRAASERRLYCDECADVVRREWRKNHAVPKLPN